MLWFESLLFYGCEDPTALQRGDSDSGLLPSIVERVILPKLAGVYPFQKTVCSENMWGKETSLKLVGVSESAN